jgi:hypothetical protein
VKIIKLLPGSGPFCRSLRGIAICHWHEEALPGPMRMSRDSAPLKGSANDNRLGLAIYSISGRLVRSLKGAG